jgi:hypothetical protein
VRLGAQGYEPLRAEGQGVYFGDGAKEVMGRVGSIAVRVCPRSGPGFNAHDCQAHF